MNVTGGLRRGTLSISGPEVGRLLKLEGGVHRVQRVPSTERSGRVHTSTATIAVLPCPAEVFALFRKSPIIYLYFRKDLRSVQQRLKTTWMSPYEAILCLIWATISLMQNGTLRI